MTRSQEKSRGRSIDWHVYILLCSDDTLYTGITMQIARRFGQHATGTGAKYFRGRQPLRLVYLEGGHTRSSASRREAEIKGMTRAEKTILASSWGYALFTDVSVNPQLKCGVGAYTVLPVSFLENTPEAIEPTDIAEQLLVRRFADTSSTKLEVQTVVWALEEYRKERHLQGTAKLLLYTDSQCVVGLQGRRAALESRGFISKATQQELPNASLYRRYYQLADELGLDVIKVAGHSRLHSLDTVHTVFSVVDRAVRTELRFWIDQLNAPLPKESE